VSAKRGSGPAAVPAMRRFAQSARQRGMPDLPDTDPNGGGFPTRSDRQLAPAFKPALDACRTLLPAAG
jgi:hypothetical protein